MSDWCKKKKSTLMRADPTFKDYLKKEYPNISDPERTRFLLDKLLGPSPFKKMRKRGSIQDILFIIITIIVLSIGTLVAFKVSDSINTQFQDSDLITSTGKTAMGSINNMYPGVVDNGFLLLMIGLCIVAIALASMVRIHPIFFVFFIIIMVIIVFISGVFSNLYQGIASNSEFVALAEQLTFTTYIMRFLPFITGIMGFVLSFIMYKTWQNA